MARALLLAILGIFVVGPARAERVAVARFEISGGNEAVRRELAAGFAGGLAAGGSEVVEISLVESALQKTPGLRGCDTATCAERLAQLVGAQRIARGRVTIDGSSFALLLELADGIGGRVLGTIVDRCDVCTVKEAADRVSAQARALLAKISYVPPAPPPAIAVPVAAPAPANAIVAAPPAKTARPIYTAAKWTAAAAALGFIAASIVMFAENGRGTCDSPSGVECPRIYDTTLEGGVFLGIGVLTAVASATLFWLDR